MIRTLIVAVYFYTYKFGMLSVPITPKL